MLKKVKDRVESYKKGILAKKAKNEEKEFFEKMQQKNIQYSTHKEKISHGSEPAKETEEDNLDTSSWAVVVDMKNGKNNIAVRYVHSYTAGEVVDEIIQAHTPEVSTLYANVVCNDEIVYRTKSVNYLFHDNYASAIDAITNNERERELSEKDKELSLLVRLAAPMAKKVLEPIDLQKQEAKERYQQEENKRRNEEKQRQAAIQKKLDNFFDR